MVLSRVKTLAYLLIVAFLIYAIFKSPDQAASIVRTRLGRRRRRAARDRPLLRRAAGQQQSS